MCYMYLYYRLFYTAWLLRKSKLKGLGGNKRQTEEGKQKKKG